MRSAFNDAYVILFSDFLHKTCCGYLSDFLFKCASSIQMEFQFSEQHFSDFFRPRSVEFSYFSTKTYAVGTH